MKVMLTENIATELGLANGTIGIFHRLIYETEESNLDYIDSPEFCNQYRYVTRPLVALIEIPDHRLKFKFEDLPWGIVPISVRTKSFKVDITSEFLKS